MAGAFCRFCKMSKNTSFCVLCETPTCSDEFFEAEEGAALPQMNYPYAEMLKDAPSTYAFDSDKFKKDILNLISDFNEMLTTRSTNK